MPSQSPYDLIVLGTGGVGSAAVYSAARRGLRVLGIDRFAPPHGFGSSHGQTRIIRKAYFEHPDYVPLLECAYRCWAELESAAGERLFYRTGLLQVTPHDGVVRRGVLTSAQRHQLAVDELSAEHVMRMYPGFRVGEGDVGLFEQAAGYLLVEKCIEAHLRLAADRGAERLIDTVVTAWRTDDREICIETADGTSYRAASLIITAGPWAATVLHGLGVPMTVRRKPMFWFATEGDAYRADRGCPAFLFERSGEVFYGFPQIDSLGVKVAEHSGGETVDDPAQTSRQATPAEIAAVERFIGQSLPQVSLRRNRTEVCHYTLSPDQHFLVDRHPRHSNVAFAAGLSGHGFKFASVLGEALVDLACEGGSGLPIGFLSLDRPTLKAS